VDVNTPPVFAIVDGAEGFPDTQYAKKLRPDPTPKQDR